MTTKYITKKVRKWRLNPENRKKELARNKEYRAKNKSRVFEWENRRRLKKKYGISVDEYNLIFEKQNKKCSICDVPLPDGFARNKHIDHCHKTGKVRGILCAKCNAILAMANDDIGTLLSSINYLKKFCL